MDYIIDVLADGMEQGSVSTSGNVDDSRMVRSIGYLPFLGDDDGKITVSATATTERTILVSFLGYDSDTTVTPLFAWYWYSLPHVFDISSYPNVKFFRLVLIYTGYATLPLNEVASCTLTYNYSWIMDSEVGAIPEKASSIPDSSFIKPYPASLWRIDESNDGYPYNELMPDILYRDPTPPPQPDIPECANWLSHWFIRKEDMDLNRASVMGYISKKSDRSFQPGNFRYFPHWNNSVQELNNQYYEMIGEDENGGRIRLERGDD